MQIHPHSIYELGRRATTMADTADGNESAGSAETDATVDERDLPRSDEAEEPREAEAAEEQAESDEDEANGGGGGGGGGGAPSFRVREAECGTSVLVVMDICLPPVNRPGAKPRFQSYLFLRQCEELLYGSTAGSYTGALHTAVKVRVIARGTRVHASTSSHHVTPTQESGPGVVAASHGEALRPRRHGGRRVEGTHGRVHHHAPTGRPTVRASQAVHHSPGIARRDAGPGEASP